MPSIAAVRMRYYWVQNNYERGDFLGDTAPLPDMTQVASDPGSTSYDTSTCQAGVEFPKDCSDSTFQ